jgi:putative transposase
MVTPAARREAVQRIRDRFELSERRACDLVGMCRSTVRYRPTESETNRWLLRRLSELAATRPRYGYRRLHTMVRREGRKVNHKRVYRLYTVLGLAVRRKKRKRVAQANRRPRVIPERANEQWSMDFMSDVLADSRRLRTLNIVDDATRECLAIEVDTSIGGSRVARVLDQVASWRGLPERIVVDNGPEFTSKALDQWAYERGVELRFIRPGRPTENCIIESFNGRFRDECLNLHWFTTLADARTLIATWRHDYNHFRPHSSLGGKPPVEFAEQAGLRPTPSASVLLAAHIGTHEDHPRC